MDVGGAASETSTLGSVDLTAPIDSPLDEVERWWRDHHAWLAEHGYMLRPRYRPDWVPSWKAKPQKYPWRREDWVSPINPFVLDAVRVSDKELVVLKKIKKSISPTELDMAEYVSSEPFRSSPRNHCLPLLDVLYVPDDPDVVILVTLFLKACNAPKWTTLGEAVSFMWQVFEGLDYMHEHYMAHRDCMALNIMYDPRPIYPKMFHPQRQTRQRNFKGRAKHSTRTLHPVKYYFIDFGLSTRYDPADGPPREHPIRGGDKSVPEFQNWAGELLDLFPTDVYYLGNMVRLTILQKFQGMEFAEGLIQDMTQSDPSKRPIMPEVMRRFMELKDKLETQTLRSRLIPQNEHPSYTSFYRYRHWYRTLRYIILRKAPIPLSS